MIRMPVPYPVVEARNAGRAQPAMAPSAVEIARARSSSGASTGFHTDSLVSELAAAAVSH